MAIDWLTSTSNQNTAYSISVVSSGRKQIYSDAQNGQTLIGYQPLRMAELHWNRRIWWSRNRTDMKSH